MMYEFFKYFLLFVMYSFSGWLFEVIVVFFTTKKFSNRGFLIGPVCPIYGIASFFMLYLLNKYKNDYIILFCMSAIICTIVEYLTSFIMEKLFKTRWWDYSNNKFNLNGRICLQDSLIFGFLGILVILYINSFFLQLIDFLPNILLFILSIVIFTIFVIDISISFNVMNKVKMVTSNIRKDSTDEVNEIVKKFIKNNSVLYKRLFKAFPNLKFLKTKIGKK